MANGKRCEAWLKPNEKNVACPKRLESDFYNQNLEKHLERL